MITFNLSSSFAPTDLGWDKKINYSRRQEILSFYCMRSRKYIQIVVTNTRRKLDQVLSYQS